MVCNFGVSIIPTFSRYFFGISFFLLNLKRSNFVSKKYIDLKPSTNVVNMHIHHCPPQSHIFWGFWEPGWLLKRKTWFSNNFCNFPFLSKFRVIEEKKWETFFIFFKTHNTWKHMSLRVFVDNKKNRKEMMFGFFWAENNASVESRQYYDF